MQGSQSKGHRAAVRDRTRVRERFDDHVCGKLARELCEHIVGGGEREIILVHGEPLRIMDRVARLDRERDVMWSPMISRYSVAMRSAFSVSPNRTAWESSLPRHEERAIKPSWCARRSSLSMRGL